MAGERELALGVLFRGKVDRSFKDATRRLENVLRKLNGTLENTAKTGLKNVSQGLNKTKQETEQVERSFESLNTQVKQTSTVMDRLNKAFKTVSTYGIVASTVYRVVDAFKSGTQSIIDYDQALKNLQAITGATESQISAMDDVMRDVARNTKFSTNEVAEGMTLLGQAGFSAEESLSAIRATADLATGTMSSFQLTSDLMTTTIRAFGLHAEEAGRVADVMANAINNSKLNIDKLRIAFNFVGAASAQAGLSLEETAASLMVLANNGLRASTMGTGLRQVMSRLLSPNKKLREAFQQFNVDLKEINPRLAGWQNSMKNLLPVIWDHSKGTVDMARAYELFGLRGAQAVSILSKEMAGGGFAKALEKTTEIGAAAAMASIQAEGLGIKFKQLADRGKLVFQALGDAGLTGILTFFVDTLRETLKVTEDFVSSGLGSFLIKAAASTAAVILLTKGFLALKAAILGITAIRAAIIGFNIMLAANFTKAYAAGSMLWGLISSINPWFLAAAAIGTAVAAIIHFGQASEKSAKEASEAAVKQDEVVTKLNIYKELLSKASGDQEKYNNLIKRFAEENKELAEEIRKVAGVSNLAAVEFEKLKQIFESVTTERLKQSIDKSIEALNHFIEVKKNANEQLGKDKDILKLNPQEFGPAIKSVKLYRQEISALADRFYDYTQLLKIPQERIKFIVKGLISEKSAQEEILKLIEQKYIEEAKIVDIRKTQAKQFVEEMPQAWQKAMSSSTVEMKVALLDEYKLMKSHKARMRKELDTLLLAKKINEKDYNKFLEEIENSHLQKWKDSQERKIKKAESNDDKLEKMKIAHLQKMLSYETDQEKKLELRKEIELRSTELWYKKALELAGKNKEEILEVNKEYKERIAAIEGLTTQMTQKESKKRLEEVEKDFRARRISAEKYINELKILESEGKITTREVEERTIAATGTFTERMSLGLKKFSEDVTTWGDTTIEIFEKLPTKFADGMSTAFADFITGTRNAREAFADFARSTLNWMVQMIIRQQMLNLMMSAGNAFGGFFGGAAAGAGATPSITGSMVTQLHSGGIIGKPTDVRIVNPNIFQNAPRFHTGGLVDDNLRKDEVPAILQKGEGVFTPEQMQALGKQELNIINVPDQRYIEGFLATAKGKRAILNVLTQEASTVKRLMR